MIQPTIVKNNIPFLTSEAKAEILNKYLDSNEPKLFVPQTYIDINTVSTSTLPQVSHRYGSQVSNRYIPDSAH